MKRRSRLCMICARRPPTSGSWCAQCNESYDRARRTDDGTVLASMAWAAKRARRFTQGAQADTIRKLRSRLKRLIGRISAAIGEDFAPGTGEPSYSELRAMVETLLRSARPHPVEHPTMWRAWGEAAALLRLDDRAHRTGTSN